MYLKNNPNTKIVKILNYINEYPRTKYECIVNILNKCNTKYKLRGYYSHTFKRLKDNGILKLDTKTHKYSLTKKGKQELYQILKGE